MNRGVPGHEAEVSNRDANRQELEDAIKVATAQKARTEAKTREQPPSRSEYGTEEELEEAHDVFDALMAGSREELLADRLRHFVALGAGARVACLLNVDAGKALARFHLERSGHPENCPCNPCRDARRLR